MRVSAASEISCVRPLVGISPGAVALVVGVGSLGGGAVTPTVGTSPAKAEAERTQVRVSVIIKRFIDVSPLKVEDARVLTSGKNRATSRSSCKGRERTTNIRSVW